MPQLYASARESINVSSSKDRAQFSIQYYVQCSHWAFIWSIYWCAINRIKGYAGLFGGTISIILFYFSTSSVFSIRI